MAHRMPIGAASNFQLGTQAPRPPPARVRQKKSFPMGFREMETETVCWQIGFLRNIARLARLHDLIGGARLLDSHEGREFPNRLRSAQFTIISMRLVPGRPTAGPLRHKGEVGSAAVVFQNLFFFLKWMGRTP